MTSKTKTDTVNVGGTSAVPITLSAASANRNIGGTQTDATQVAEPMARTRSGGLQTTDGTIYVSKPFRTAGNKRSRAIISFVPRNSTFDPQDEAKPNEFRGFFALFWISVFLLVLQNYVSSYEKTGYPIELAFASMITRHSVALALSDAVLMASTGFCVFFAKALQKNWFDYYGTGIFIQHLYQTMVISIAVPWTFNRQWPWVQSGFFTLHSIVLIMKMHSYMATNGYLQKVNRQFEQVYASLRSATSAAGGWETVLTEAQARAPSSSPSPSENTLSVEGGTPALEPGPDGSQRSYIDGDMAMALRKRLDASTARNDLAESNGNSGGASVTEAQQREQPEYAVMVHHQDEQIASLAQELLDLNIELTGPLGKVRWPDNISWAAFGDYMLIPTLVYELEYPRTERIRPLYLFEKTVATFGTFALLLTMTENFILPLVPTKEQSFFRSLLDLSLPFMVAYLLLFYIIFECICNGFAELARFADREFYEDWTYRWNSSSWDEFARKWNKPVHAFLLRHVYASSLSSGRFSKRSAMTLTFFLSACVHELVMAVVTKKFRMYLFVMQLCQIPLIAIGRIPAIKRNKILGNVVFWLGLYAGFPLLCVAYCAY